MTTESMKVYYYESAAWNQITDIVNYPTISKMIDMPSTCSLEVAIDPTDYNASYTAWEARDFTQMKVEDNQSNILFQGYLVGKTFREHSVILRLNGFGALLDWTPFDKDYVKATGDVKSLAYNATGEETSLHADNTNVRGVYFDGTYYYALNYSSLGDEEVVKYDSDWSYVSTTTLGAGNNSPRGLTSDGTYFYVIDDTDAKVYKYDSSWTLDSSTATDASNGDPWGICYVGEYFYIVDRTDNKVYQYDTSFTLEGSFDLNAGNTDAHGIEYYDGYFYVVDSNDDKVYKYDSTFTYQTNYDMDGSNNLPAWICVGADYFYVTNLSALGQDSIFRYMRPSFNVYHDNYAIELKDADGNDFTWDPNYWVETRDVGFLLVDNTSGFSDKFFLITNVAATGTSSSTTLSKATSLDNQYVYAGDNTGDIDASLTLTIDIDGASIPSTSVISSIKLDYRWGLHNNLIGTPPSSYADAKVEMQINKDGSYTTHKECSAYTEEEEVDTIWIGEGDTDDGDYIIEDTSDELKKYLDTDVGGDYDSLKGIKFVLSGTGSTYYLSRVYLDYLKVTVYYTSATISPIMKPIIDNGASWIVSDFNYNTSGAAVGDGFKIGDNTERILGNAISEATLTLNLLSDWSKYMARAFFGSTCMEALRAVCELEGWHWSEDHTNKRIVVGDSADFESSSITLDSEDYTREWDLEDECNHYKGVRVYGYRSSDVEINEAAEDPDSTSLIWKQIINETILTEPEAADIAENQLEELETKRGSKKISVVVDTTTSNALSAAEIMKTVNVTFIRPTIIATDYIMRRIDIEKFGAQLKYTLYLGLGSTPPEEKMAQMLRQLYYMAHKSKTDRLINY